MIDIVRFRDFDRRTGSGKEVEYINRSDDADYEELKGSEYLVGYRIGPEADGLGNDEEEFRVNIADLGGLSVDETQAQTHTLYAINQSITNVLNGDVTMEQLLAASPAYISGESCQYGIVDEVKAIYTFTKDGSSDSQEVPIVSYTFIPPDEVTGNDALDGKYKIEFDTATSTLTLKKHGETICSTVISGTGGGGSGTTYSMEKVSDEEYHLVDGNGDQVGDAIYIPTGDSSGTQTEGDIIAPELQNVNVTSGTDISDSGEFVEVDGELNIYDLNLNIHTVQGPQGPQGPAGANGTNGTNGINGVGIAGISGPVTAGLVDTYTITLTNGTQYTFDVDNGSGVRIMASQAECVQTGDGYISSDGHLWVLNSGGSFVDCGEIKGPKGDAGEAYFSASQYGTNQALIKFYTDQTKVNTDYLGLFVRTLNGGQKGLEFVVNNYVNTQPTLVSSASVLIEDGASAYEIAVANGFVGTETEWLDSLKGDDGTPGANATVSIASQSNLGTSVIFTNPNSQNHSLSVVAQDGTGANSKKHYIYVYYDGLVASTLTINDGADGTNGTNGTTFELYKVILFDAVSAGSTSPYKLSYVRSKVYKFEGGDWSDDIGSLPAFDKTSVVDICPDVDDESNVMTNFVNGAFGLLKPVSGSDEYLANYYTVTKIATGTDFVFTVKVYSNVQ